MAESAFEVPRVKLGNQGLEVSKLGYGCAGLSGYYNDPVQEEVAIALIHYAFGKGITFFDTSDMYGADHANEKLVGKAENELVGESSMCLLPATTKKQAAWSVGRTLQCLRREWALKGSERGIMQLFIVSNF
ncbi:hypothetical protein U1Q18_049153 [Sarracenia purpurea var. burkii]